MMRRAGQQQLIYPGKFVPADELGRAGTGGTRAGIHREVDKTVCLGRVQAVWPAFCALNELGASWSDLGGRTLGSKERVVVPGSEFRRDGDSMAEDAVWCEPLSATRRFMPCGGLYINGAGDKPPPQRVINCHNSLSSSRA